MTPDQIRRHMNTTRQAWDAAAEAHAAAVCEPADPSVVDATYRALVQTHERHMWWRRVGLLYVARCDNADEPEADRILLAALEETRAEATAFLATGGGTPSTPDAIDLHRERARITASQEFLATRHLGTSPS